MYADQLTSMQVQVAKLEQSLDCLTMGELWWLERLEQFKNSIPVIPPVPTAPTIPAFPATPTILANPTISAVHTNPTISAISTTYTASIIPNASTVPASINRAPMVDFNGRFWDPQATKTAAVDQKLQQALTNPRRRTPVQLGADLAKVLFTEAELVTSTLDRKKGEW